MGLMRPPRLPFIALAALLLLAACAGPQGPPAPVAGAAVAPSPGDPPGPDLDARAPRGRSEVALPPNRASDPASPPRVLLLGDSISIGYTPFVREHLAEVASVSRPMRTRAEGASPRPENCEGTNKGARSVERWLAMDGAPFDVIHFNFGLHDMKRVDPDSGRNSSDPLDPHQAGPERYRRQLLAITRALGASGAQLVFATTTPVPSGELRPYREPGDAVAYNRVALEIMEQEGVPVNDLFSLVSHSEVQLQKPEDVHFTREGSRTLGRAVAGAILEAMETADAGSTD